MSHKESLMPDESIEPRIYALKQEAERLRRRRDRAAFMVTRAVVAGAVPPADFVATFVDAEADLDLVLDELNPLLDLRAAFMTGRL